MWRKVDNAISGMSSLVCWSYCEKQIGGVLAQ